MTMENIKTYMAEVIVRKMAPAAIASAVAAAGTFLLAHASELEKYGITYYPDFAGVFSGTTPSGNVLIVEFDTLQKGLALVLVALVGAFMAWTTHHTVATVTGAPQSGDKRVEPPQPVVGGERKEDPKSE